MAIDYSRQEGIERLRVSNVATVVGTGAVGSWLAYFAALSGVKRLRLYAMGPVKATDIARLPFAPHMVGKPYAVAVSNLLLSVRPEIELVIEGEFRPRLDPLEGLVFNCAASPVPNFAQELFQQCVDEGLPYISGGYKGTAVFAIDRVRPDMPPPSLEPVPVWAGSAALTALAFLHLGFSKETLPIDEFQVDLFENSLSPISLSVIDNHAV